MQHVVSARPIVAEMVRFWGLLNDGTINGQEPDGSEIVASMKTAVMSEGKVSWYEKCFCTPPLQHERSTVYDRFFTDMKIESRVGPVHFEGERFWDQLRAWNTGRDGGSPPVDGIANVARYVPVRIL